MPRATTPRVEHRVDLNGFGSIEKPIDLQQPNTVVGVYRAHESKARRPDVAFGLQAEVFPFLRALGSTHGGLETTATRIAHRPGRGLE